jgi:hypothetical protein
LELKKEGGMEMRENEIMICASPNNCISLPPSRALCLFPLVGGLLPAALQRLLS